MISGDSYKEIDEIILKFGEKHKIIAKDNTTETEILSTLKQLVKGQEELKVLIKEMIGKAN